MAETTTIYGQFTEAGPVTEVKPSADEEVQMMRQMTFLPEGLLNPSLILVDKYEAKYITLNQRMCVDVQKSGDLLFAVDFGYEPIQEKTT